MPYDTGLSTSGKAAIVKNYDEINPAVFRLKIFFRCALRQQHSHGASLEALLTVRAFTLITVESNPGAVTTVNEIQ